MSSAPANVLAGLVRRILAAVLDLIVIGLALMARDALMKGDGPVEQVVLIGIPVAYFVMLPATGMQGTFGKRLVGIKIASIDGTPIGLVASIIRFVMSLLVPLTAGLTFVTASWTARHQALHDLAAKSVVVRSAATPAEISWAMAPPSWIARIAGIVLVAAVAAGGAWAYQTYQIEKIDWKCVVKNATALDRVVGCRLK